MHETLDTDSQKLTGLEKASVLMMSLGATESARVFEQLSAEERELLGSQILRLRPIGQEERCRVLGEAPDALRSAAESPGHHSALAKVRGAAACVFGAVGRGLRRAPAHPPVAAKLESPEDLLWLTETQMRSVLTTVTVDDLSLVLSVAGKELKTAVFRNIPPELGRLLRKQVDAPGELRLGEIDEARARFVESLRQVGLREVVS